MLGALDCFLPLGGTTSVSSATDAEASDRIISSWRLLNDCHVISTVPVVDTEVDPPQQFSPANVDPPILLDPLQKALRLCAR
jgi:hypothetical protein